MPETQRSADPPDVAGHDPRKVLKRRWVECIADHDASVMRSQILAEQAIANGFQVRYNTPVLLADGNVVKADYGPRARVTSDADGQLRLVFRPVGTVTAGNCCALSNADLAELRKQKESR